MIKVPDGKEGWVEQPGNIGRSADKRSQAKMDTGGKRGYGCNPCSQPERDVCQCTGETDFIACRFWGHAAEDVFQYCRKGSVIVITGKICTGHHVNNEGNNVDPAAVIAERVYFLDRKRAPEIEPAANIPESSGRLK